MVSETLTSDVDTISTGVSKRSKTSKMRRRKPCAPSMRVERMLTTVMPRLQATDFRMLRARNRFGNDFRSRRFRAARVENPHRNIFFLGGQHRGGMQDLRAEISQFGGFVEGNGAHRMRIGNEIADRR